MTTPKWQAPLAERAAAADHLIRTAMSAPGGGTGALQAVAAANREIADLCHQYAQRSPSPLLQQLLQHGARALNALAHDVDATVHAHTEHTPITPAACDGRAVSNGWGTAGVREEHGEGQALVDEPTDEPPMVVVHNNSDQTRHVDLVVNGQEIETFVEPGETQSFEIAPPPAEDQVVVDEPQTTDESTVDEVADTPGNIQHEDQAAAVAAAETPYPQATPAPIEEQTLVDDLAERRREAEWQGLHVYRDGSRPPVATMLVDGELYAATGWADIYGDQPVWSPGSPLAAVTEPRSFGYLVTHHVVTDVAAAQLGHAELARWKQGWASALGDVAAALELPRDTDAVALLEEITRLRELAARDAPAGTP